MYTIYTIYNIYNRFENWIYYHIIDLIILRLNLRIKTGILMIDMLIKLVVDHTQGPGISMGSSSERCAVRTCTLNLIHYNKGL